MIQAPYLKKILLASIVLILLCGVLFFLGFTDIRTKNEHISTLNRDLSLQAKKEQYLISMQTVIHNDANDIASVNNSIIPKDGDVSFIENFESLARSHGLDISIDSLVFEDNPSLGSTALTSFDIKVKTKGSWSGTYLFLSEIENLPFKIKVDHVDLVNTTDDGSVGAGGTGATNSAQMWQVAFEIHVLKYK